MLLLYSCTHMATVGIKLRATIEAQFTGDSISVLMYRCRRIQEVILDPSDDGNGSGFAVQRG